MAALSITYFSCLNTCLPIRYWRLRENYWILSIMLAPRRGTCPLEIIRTARQEAGDDSTLPCKGDPYTGKFLGESSAWNQANPLNSCRKHPLRRIPQESQLVETARNGAERDVRKRWISGAHQSQCSATIGIGGRIRELQKFENHISTKNKAVPFCRASTLASVVQTTTNYLAITGKIAGLSSTRFDHPHNRCCPFLASPVRLVSSFFRCLLAWLP